MNTQLITEVNNGLDTGEYVIKAIANAPKLKSSTKYQYIKDLRNYLKSRESISWLLAAQKRPSQI